MVQQSLIPPTVPATTPTLATLTIFNPSGATSSASSSTAAPSERIPLIANTIAMIRSLPPPVEENMPETPQHTPQEVTPEDFHTPEENWQLVPLVIGPTANANINTAQSHVAADRPQFLPTPSYLQPQPLGAPPTAPQPTATTTPASRRYARGRSMAHFTCDGPTCIHCGSNVHTSMEWRSATDEMMCPCATEPNLDYQ